MNFKRKYSASLLLALVCAGTSSYALSNTTNIPDTDGDGYDDLVDRDDDNDGIADTQELCLSNYDASNDITAKYIHVHIDLDVYETHTSWDIVDSDGTVIAKSNAYDGGFPILTVGGVVTGNVGTEFDNRAVKIIKNGTYTFTIRDGGGILPIPDGLSGSNINIFNMTDGNWQAGYSVHVGNKEERSDSDILKKEEWDYPNFGDKRATPIEISGIVGADGFNCLDGDPNADLNENGKPDYKDADYIAKQDPDVWARADLDNDGIINSLDLDSDGDGVPDVVEAQSTSGFELLSEDGVSADDSVKAKGVNLAYVTEHGGLQPVHSDEDGYPDFLDTNADDDKTVDDNGDFSPKTDSDESGLVISLSKDIDNNGISDDLAATYALPYGIINSPVNDLQDSDGDATAEPCDNETCDVDYRDGEGVPYVELTLALNLINDDKGLRTVDAWTLSATSGVKTISGQPGDAAITKRALAEGTYDLAINEVTGYEYEGVVCVGPQDTDVTDGLDLYLHMRVVCTFTVNDVDEVAPVVTIDQALLSANANNSNAYSILGNCGSKATDNNVVVKVEGAGQQSSECAEGRWAAIFDVSGLPDGTDVVVINAMQDDESGNVGNAESVSYNKDTSTPTFAVTNNGDTSSSSNSVTFAGVAAGDDGEVLTILVKRGEEFVVCAENVVAGAQWSCDVDLTPLGDGEHVIQPAVADAAGNMTLGEAKQVTVSGSGASSEFKTSKSSSGGAFNLAWLMLISSFFGLSLMRRK